MVRFHRSISLAALVGLALTGCPDPEGEFEDHLERVEDHLDAAFEPMIEPDVGVTESVPQASGTYLLAVEASADPSKPLLFKAEIVIDDMADPPTIDMSLIPLVPPAVADGDPALTARDELPEGTLDPTAVEVTQNDEEQWIFEVDFGDFTLPGNSDPILPGQEIAGNMVWRGRVATDAVLCGEVDGELTAPAAVPLTGSTFGSIKVADGDVTGPAEAAGTCAESLSQ